MTPAVARWLLALALAPLAWTAAAADPGELLDPDKAFRVSVRPIDARTVEVEFRIAEGYYMYRDRFSFATESGRTIADAEIPRGKLKHDEFFGTTETFRQLVRIRVPLRAGDIEKGSVRLIVTYRRVLRAARAACRGRAFRARQCGRPMSTTARRNA